MNRPDALTRLRGGFEATPLDARRIAATLLQPGCGRRTVLDAAQVQLDKLAALLGAPDARQSPFALGRGNTFERLVLENGMADLLALAREKLGLAITDARQVDLSADQVLETFGRQDSRLRAELTKQRLREMLEGDANAPNLLRHPLFTIAVAGVTHYVEADVLALVDHGVLHVIEIKGYQAVDGRPDQSKVAETALQTAVYLIAMQDAVVALGYQPDRVSADMLLVVPRNFGMTAEGFVVNIASLGRRLRRHLAAMPLAERLALEAGDGESLPPLPANSATAAERQGAREQAAQAVSSLPLRFSDGCSRCPLFRFCRDEVRLTAAVVATGSQVAAFAGDVGTVDYALELARNQRVPRTVSEAYVAKSYGRAVRALSKLGL